MTVFCIKLVHSVIFWVLTICVLYALYSGIADRLGRWTWIALLAVLAEGIVLSISRWRCPLTTLAERQGASTGRVSDLFLPRWFADRLFGICGTLFAVACAAILVRWLGR